MWFSDKHRNQTYFENMNENQLRIIYFLDKYIAIHSSILFKTKGWIIDKRIVYSWPLSALLEQYTVYSLSVSAMEILFSSGNTTK